MTEKLKQQLEEKEQIRDKISKSQNSISRNTEENGRQETYKRDVRTLKVLQKMAQEVIEDDLDGYDRTYDDVDPGSRNGFSKINQNVVIRHSHSFSPERVRSLSHSPTRRRSEPPLNLTDSTISIVQEAINKRQHQIVELRSRLDSFHSENESLKKQMFDREMDHRELECQLQMLKEEREKL